MEHTFLVAENHLRSLDLHQSLQTVVTNDDATIEVVEVGCGETSTIQGHQRAQLGRRNGNDLHDHPLRPVCLTAAAECLHHLQTFQSLGLTLLRRVVVGSATQFLCQQVEVEIHEQVVDCLGTHFGDKLIGVGVLQTLIAFGKTVFDDVEIFIFRNEVVLMRAVELHSLGILLSLESTWLDHHILLVIDD